MDIPALDHRGAEFAEIGYAVLAGCQRIFGTKQPVIIYPSSGSGAWEGALVNTLLAGRQGTDVRDRPVCGLWRGIEVKLKLEVDVCHRLAARRRRQVIEARLAEDRNHRIKAVVCGA